MPTCLSWRQLAPSTVNPFQIRKYQSDCLGRNTIHRHLYIFPSADLRFECGPIPALLLIWSHTSPGIIFQASRFGSFNCNFLRLHDLFISGCTQKSTVSPWSLHSTLLALKFHKPPRAWQVEKLTRVIRQQKKSTLSSDQLRPQNCKLFRSAAHSLLLKRETLLQYWLYCPCFPHSSAEIKCVSVLMKAILTSYILAVNYQIGSLSEE